MSMLKRLLRQIASRATGRQHVTPLQIRDWIEAGDLSRAEAALETLPADLPKRDVLVDTLKGEIAFRQFRDEEAEKHFRRALKEDPGSSEAHYGLSLIAQARGELELAIRHAQFAANRRNMEPRFRAQIGLCHLGLKNFNAAADALGDATRLNSSDKSSWNNLGIARRAQGNMQGARKAFMRAIELDPSFATARANLQSIEVELAARVNSKGEPSPEAPMGQAPTSEVTAVDAELAAVRDLVESGSLVEAIEACERLCTTRPDDLAVALELYRLYCDRGDVHSGLDALEAFRARHPDDIEMVGELGKALEREREFSRAEPLLEAALKVRANDVSLMLALADVRVDKGRFSDAGALIERAYELEPSIHMKGRLASTLLMRCRYADALKIAEEMLAEDARVADGVLGIRVDSMAHLGRQAEALPLLDAQIEKHPYEPGLRFPRAEINLLSENFGAGWDDYSYRNLSSTRHLRMVAFPQWKGESLEGKSILVLAEQGLGDQVMFASCLTDLLALRPARVVVEVVKRVAPTIARSFPQCEVIATKQDAGLEWVRDIGDMDYFTPIGDLPQRFRRTAESFPHHDGYLQADPQRVAYWREQLAALGLQPKIGVAWRGGTERTRTVLRTMEPAMLAGLAQSVAADWVCLQYGDVKQGIADAAQHGMKLHHWPSAIENLDEFAALISALDLVVTVCNTTVHYAGGVGKPVWVMAPKVPEWRYGLRFRSMPWYPSSVMYRQSEDGDWAGVLAAVRRDLSTRFPQDCDRLRARG